MKDNEFLELLNLYLDHEISAADAARLEAEVQSNPERRRIYRDYCQMQKACTLLAREFAEQPTARTAAVLAPRHPAWNPALWATAGGFTVAAACVALVLVNYKRTPAPNASDLPQTQLTTKSEGTTPILEKSSNAVVAATTTAQPATAPIARAVTVAPRRAGLQPIMVTLPLTLVGANRTNAEALLAAAQQNAQAQFEWMKSVQLAPIQQVPMDELRLDARAPLQPASRTYSSGQPLQTTVEMTAFRFQR